jgi:ABC-type uncharacterized transport system substrate-binding protein
LRHALCVLLFRSGAAAKKVYRIGYLSGGTPSAAAAIREAFLDGMHQLGYTENHNLLVEYRYAEGRSERIPELAADLVRLKVDVIIAAGTQATSTAKHATTTIPIVTPSSSDLFSKGVAETLARPGGNVTGISTMGVELSGKRLEIFRETFPKVRRLAVVWYKEGSIAFQEIWNAAQPFGFNSFSLEVARPDDFDRVFAVGSRERPHGLFVVESAFIAVHRKRIIDFAAKSKLPAMYFQETFVEDGGLMSYSPSIKDSYRYAAIFVDKILKGAKPADLPIEQPRKFELWFNLKTATQIGVTIPPNVLARADKVIR